MFAVLFGGAVALLPAIAEERLGVGSIGYGWLRAAPGIGAVVVTALLALRPVRRRVGTTLLVAVAVFGAATVVLGVTTSYVLAFVALLVLSGADAVSVFIRATIVPLATPDEMRGRVMAVENVFIGASNELGAFESGVAGALLGVGPAVWLGGLLTMHRSAPKVSTHQRTKSPHVAASSTDDGGRSPRCQRSPMIGMPMPPSLRATLGHEASSCNDARVVGQTSSRRPA